MNLQEKRKIEQKKYFVIKNRDKNYGSSFHGKSNISEILKYKNEIDSIIDVGTGQGEFCKWSANNLCNEVYGLDFAFTPSNKNLDDKITYFRGFAHDLPLKDKQVDALSSFDMLEHLLEEDVDNVLDEFYRVTKKYFFFSICDRDSLFMKELVGSLHPTVKSLDWWVNKIEKYGEVLKQDKFVTVKL